MFKRRVRWNREKQRRAGSSEVFELLLYKGRFDPAFLEHALMKISSSASEGTDCATKEELHRCASVAKHELRLSRKLQRDVSTGWRYRVDFTERARRVYREAQDGSLLRRVNDFMLQSGRGRLRGENDSDCLDIGQQRLDRDGEPVDTSRFQTRSRGSCDGASAARLV